MVPVGFGKVFALCAQLDGRQRSVRGKLEYALHCLSSVLTGVFKWYAIAIKDSVLRKDSVLTPAALITYFAPGLHYFNFY